MVQEEYKLAQQEILEKIRRDLTKDTIRGFYPSWYTEHWVNVQTGSGDRLTFRFERPGYIGTIFASQTEHHYFALSHQRGSMELGHILRKQDPSLVLHEEGNSSSIGEVAKRVLGGKQIASLDVVRGEDRVPDFVRATTIDDSYGMVAFLPNTLIAIEYHGKDGDKIFGVEGKDIAHRRLNLMASVMSGKDVIYLDKSQAVGEIFILPDLKHTPRNHIKRLLN